jgi:hypothetical protein
MITALQMITELTTALETLSIDAEDLHDIANTTEPCEGCDYCEESAKMAEKTLIKAQAFLATQGQKIVCDHSLFNRPCPFAEELKLAEEAHAASRGLDRTITLLQLAHYRQKYQDHLAQAGAVEVAVAA